METLDFSTNWNGKLFTNNLSTIRASTKYQSPDPVLIALGGKPLYQARLVNWNRLYDIDDRTAYLDTGYNAQKTYEIIETMYVRIPDTLYIYVLQRIPGTETTAYRNLLLAAAPQPTLFDAPSE